MDKTEKKRPPAMLTSEQSEADVLYSQAIDEFEAEERERKKSKNRFKKIPRVRVLGIAFGALLLVYGVIWLWPVPSEMPSQLIGMWRTDHTAYADRFIELHYATVSFGTGRATASTGFIRKVEVVFDGNRTLYHLTYLQDGRELRLSFYYNPGDSTLRLKNKQNVIWRKEDLSSSLSSENAARPAP